jgi:hypothetical protein
MPKTPRFAPNAVRVIEVLAYPAVQLLDVAGPLQVFASTNDLIAEAGECRPTCFVSWHKAAGALLPRLDWGWSRLRSHPSGRPWIP